MKQYLQPPTNYTGSKHKLIEQFLQYFPKENTVDTFYDVFCGGLSVSINCDYKKIIANDIILPLISFYKNLQTASLNDDVENEIIKILSYAIPKDSPEKYAEVRKDFNLTADNPYLFFALVSSCTNNMMRFNKSFKFNQTFGKRSINDNTVKKIVDYCDVIKEKEINFTNKSYPDLFKDNPPNKNSFVYYDPPYLSSEAGYNAYWSKELEIGLFDVMKDLDDSGIRFAYSNVSVHKGIENPYMKKYLNKYNVIEMEQSYEKVARNKNTESKEILVTNY